MSFSRQSGCTMSDGATQTGKDLCWSYLEWRSFLVGEHVESGYESDIDEAGTEKRKFLISPSTIIKPDISDMEPRWDVEPFWGYPIGPAVRSHLSSPPLSLEEYQRCVAAMKENRNRAIVILNQPPPARSLGKRVRKFFSRVFSRRRLAQLYD